nr:hypothetical protein [Arthrobacter sp. ISL-65]
MPVQPGTAGPACPSGLFFARREPADCLVSQGVGPLFGLCFAIELRGEGFDGFAELFPGLFDVVLDVLDSGVPWTVPGWEGVRRTCQVPSWQFLAGPGRSVSQRRRLTELRAVG